MVLREDAHPEGVLVIHRSAHTGPYTRREQRILREIRPYLTQALSHTPGVDSTPGVDRRGPCTSGPEVPGDPLAATEGTRMAESEEGLLILDHRGRLLSRCAESALLLQMMADARLPQPRCLSTLPPPVSAAHRQLVDLWEQGYPATLSRVVLLAWGRFRLRARLMDGAEDTRVGITIRREIPLRLRLWERLHDQPLSARQGELCLWLADDLSYSDIAAEMGISRHTIVEYVQTIYRKLGVSNKEALIERLLHAPPMSK